MKKLELRITMEKVSDIIETLTEKGYDVELVIRPKIHNTTNIGYETIKSEQGSINYVVEHSPNPHDAFLSKIEKTLTNASTKKPM